MYLWRLFSAINTQKNSLNAGFFMSSILGVFCVLPYILQHEHRHGGVMFYAKLAIERAQN